MLADDTVDPVARRAGLLLTGGASLRMGVDKASLVLRGERLVDRAARVLAAVCDSVLEVGHGRSGLPSLCEEPPGDGPLAALVAGGTALGAAARDGVVVLGVDLPFVEPPLLELLASRPGVGTVVPMAGGRPQTVCARYGADALDAAAGLLEAGERSLRALLDSVRVAWVEEMEWAAVGPAYAFADVDTPAARARYGIELPEPPGRTERPG